MSTNKLAQESGSEVSITMEEALKRHAAFWRREETDRALLSGKPWVGWQPYPPFVVRGGARLEEGAEITPGLLDPSANLLANKPSSVLDGDFVNGWGPYDNCWAEAILGCRVRRAGPSVWTEPFLHNWEDVDRVTGIGSEAWLEELLEVNRALVEDAQGVFAVCQPLFRGPLDMAEAAMPTELLFAGFYEHPARLRRFLEVCADIFVTIAKRRLSETPLYHGGHVVRFEFGLWAPGTTVQFQADAMRNLSPQMYREFMFEVDRQIASQFEYPIIHTHSGSSHILQVLVDEPALRAIEVGLDPAPYGPPPLSLIPKFQMIQKAGKSLLIDGPMKPSEMETILQTLSPVGLAIRAGLLPE